MTNSKIVSKPGLGKLGLSTKEHIAATSLLYVNWQKVTTNPSKKAFNEYFILISNSRW
jgi:hypothetical protein